MSSMLESRLSRRAALRLFGVAGAAVAWLVTQSLMACTLLIRPDWWLTVGHSAAPREANMLELGRRLVTAPPLGRALEIGPALLRVLHARTGRAPLAKPTYAGLDSSTNVATIQPIRDVTGAFVVEKQQPAAAVLEVVDAPTTTAAHVPSEGAFPA